MRPIKSETAAPDEVKQPKPVKQSVARFLADLGFQRVTTSTEVRRAFHEDGDLYSRLAEGRVKVWPDGVEI
jgi:hypothetical protein